MSSQPIRYNDHDLDIQGKTLWGEARGEPHEGQIAVAWTIRNRSQRGAFAGRVAGLEGAVAAVCQAPWQFSCWNNDDPNRARLLVLSPTDNTTQHDICGDVLEGVVDDPTGGADHYFADTIATPGWAASMKQTAHIGHHIFFNSQLKPRPVLHLGVRDPNVSLVQAALASHGYYAGGAAGMYDAETYDAVRKWQADRHLDVDGWVGTQTYGSLGIK